MRNVAVLVGSLRQASLNRRLAEALAELAKDKLAFDFVGLGDLPLYNDDLWASPPAAVLEFKAAIAHADAVLFVTPEYNRSITPALKNALDWGSRPKGEAVWSGRPAAVIGGSPGAIGAAVAQAHLKYLVGVVGMPLLNQPEVYLSIKPGLIVDGQITDEATRAFLQGFLDRFAEWIELFAARKG